MPHRTLSLFAIALLWLTSSVGYGQALKWKAISTSSFRDFAVTPRVIVFVNDSNSVFRSGDTGKTWQHSGTMKVRCEYGNTVAQGNRLFMSFGYRSYRYGDTSDLGEGVYRSDDDGRTWQRVLKEQAVHVIASESMIVTVRPRPDLRPYQTDILYSTNAGASWKTMNFNLGGLEIARFVSSLESTLFLGNTLFTCSTEGLVRIVFDEVKANKVDTLLKEYSVNDIIFIQSNIVLRAEKKALLPQKGFAGTYIATSPDRGISWKTSLFNVPPEINRYWFTDSTFRLETKFYPHNKMLGMRIPFDGNFHLFSENFGQSWQFYDVLREPINKNLALGFSYRILYADKGIALVVDGINVFRIDTRGCKLSAIQGDDTREIRLWYLDSCQWGKYLQKSFSFRPQEPILNIFSENDTLYLGTTRGVFRSVSGGVHWEHLGYMNNGFLDFSNYIYNNQSIVRHKSSFFASSLGTFCLPQAPALRFPQHQCFGGYRLLRLSENSSFWQTILSYPFNSFDYTLDSIFAIGAFGNNLVAAKRDSVYYSSNSGDSWKNAAYIPRVTVFANNSRYLFAGTLTNGIYISSDTGKTWYKGKNNFHGKVKAICSRERAVFAIIDKVIWRSLDNGLTWVSINNGLSGNDILSITATKDFVVALDDKGYTFLSSNDGEQWKESSKNIEASTIFHHNNYLYGFANIVRNFSYHYSLIYKSEIPAPEIKLQDKIISHVGPNPASTHTLFTFDIESPSYVSLTVYDMLGRTVSVLADSEFSIGRHYLDWNVNFVASGVYIYRFSIGSRIYSEKILVIH
jgi:photosystem II stability/assembly factor-like uncharacterized protein